MFPGKITDEQNLFTGDIKDNSLKLVERKQYSDLSPVIIFSTSENGNIILLEGKAMNQVNIDKDVFTGRNIFSIKPSENEFLSCLKDILLKEEKTSSRIEVNGYCFEVHCTYQTNPYGDVTGIIGMARDISGDIILKEAQNIQENYFSQLFENSPEAIVILDTEDRVVNINKSFENLFQFQLGEIKGNYINGLIVPDDLTSSASELSYKVRAGETVKTETVRKSRDGSSFQVSVTAYPITVGKKQMGIYGIYNDITKRKRNEDQVKKSLVEKEILLKEIHHRVKNNLQIIGSLLNFQTKFIKDKDSLEKFKISQNRIKSIALIHEKLYQTKNVSRIEFESYVKSLAAHIFSVFGADTGNISYKINANNVFLSVDNAIPCGLIINELITNALKHAFPDNRQGLITIDLEYKNTNYFLTVSDNGVGISKDVDIDNSNTLGMQLIKTLLIQLNAEMVLNNENGTSFSIVFSNIDYKERI